MADVLDTKRLRVAGAAAPVDPDEELIERRAAPRKKLTIEVSADLHRRILMICATRRVPVNQAVREVLERAFPGT